MKQELLTHNKMIRLEGKDTATVKNKIYSPPQWFLPKPIETYEVWDDPKSSFLFL